MDVSWTLKIRHLKELKLSSTGRLKIWILLHKRGGSMGTVESSCGMGTSLMWE
eukprot:TRINITY_DN12095_c0_g1_i1.p4 TRINITY_DN12095_c0_g1~~TRINITY_DN12095_c0_g1_i1.p4  ORF type:complete len:53 (+),score=6.15 TRINITY_DN12095_c0_g1_i1:228-386(+)